MTNASETVHWPSEVVGRFEDEHDLRILSIRGYGSRAKNMSGPDSDVDAMFLFDQPALAHKRNGDTVDTIDPEPMYGVDLHGWNLKKFASLLAQSNPSAIEFLNSHLQYYVVPELKSDFVELRRYVNRNVNPLALYYHYRSYAKQNYEKYHIRKLINERTEERYRIHREHNEGYICYHIDDDAEEQPYYIYKGNMEFRETTTDRSISRYLTLLRAALNARHIRRSGDLPEMDFEAFLDAHVAPEIAEPALDLLEAKRQGLGGTETTGPLNDVIEYEITTEVDNDALRREGIDIERTNRLLERAEETIW